ncbi:MAG: zf-HC2 domain-containing protein [candidate division Zixibacteria bacterium]|nr:zf-HC2 domain-containing protein [candidate division Zixibacteria bacterium]
MNCLSREILQAYLDNEVPAETRADIERHLDECPPCRGQLESVKSDAALVRELVSQLAGEPPPIPAFVPPENRIATGAAVWTSLFDAVAGWRGRLWWPAAAAGLALLLFLTYINLSQDTSRAEADDLPEWEALSFRTNPNGMFHNRQLLVVFEDEKTGRKSAVLTPPQVDEKQTPPFDDSIPQSSQPNGG